MSSFIYLVVHRETGRCYVGKSNNPKQRWRCHRWAAKKKPTTYFLNALAKHGPDAFNWHVIEQHPTDALALEAEIFLIAYLRSIGAELFNVSAGGDGATGHRHTPEARAKMSAKRKGKSQGTWKLSPESVAHLRQRRHTAESKRKMVFAQTKLTEEVIDEIRTSSDGPIALAARFGLTRQQIWRIRTGRVFV